MIGGSSARKKNSDCMVQSRCSAEIVYLRRAVWCPSRQVLNYGETSRRIGAATVGGGRVRHLETHPSYIRMAQREDACQDAHGQAKQQRHRCFTQPVDLSLLQPLPQTKRQSQQDQLQVKRFVS